MHERLMRRIASAEPQTTNGRMSERGDAWRFEEFLPASDAREKFHAAMKKLKVNVMPSDAIFDYVLLLRPIFAQHYKSGARLPGQELAKFVEDRENVWAKLQHDRDGPFSDSERTFMIAAAVICKSIEAARMLGGCVLNRHPDKISKHMTNLRAGLSEFL